MPLRRLLVVILASLSSVGCASDWTFSSNLDRENFVEYYKPGTVALVTAEQAETKGYELLGSVEGESCREHADLPPPDPAEARTDARRQAAELGANAVIIDTCAAIQPENGDACLSAVVCFGRAIALSEDEPEQ